MKKRNGFTLVELLGVIVVLAILALITIPIISNVINDVRIKSLRDSAYGLIEASNLYYVSKEVNTTLRFDKTEEKDTLKELSYKGVVKEGTVIISKKGQVTVCITDGKNSAYKNYNESKVTTKKGKCEIFEGSSIVYLDGEATLSEYDTAKLTELANNFESRISALESENETLSSTVETLQNSLASKASSSDLSALDIRLSSSISQLSSDISVVDDKIYTPVKIDEAISFKSSTSWAYAGHSFTIPADSYYVIEVQVAYNNGQPLGVAISNSSSALNMAYCYSTETAVGNHSRHCSYGNWTGSSSQTFYVWAKYNNTSSNSGYIRGFYLQKQS